MLLLARREGRGVLLHTRDIISFLTNTDLKGSDKLRKMSLDHGPHQIAARSQRINKEVRNAGSASPDCYGGTSH